MTDYRRTGIASPPYLQPRQMVPDDNRPVATVLAAPSIGIYSTDQLVFRDTTMPVCPNGPPGDAYGGFVVYDGQPTWDRGAVQLAGPVRDFFRRMLKSRQQMRHV